MKIGDTIEAAAWLTGEETPAQVRQYKDRVREAFKELCDNKHMTHGEVRFTERKPGDERVPPVPEHIQGFDVELLIGETEVTGFSPTVQGDVGFLGDLEPKDLELLRRITRRVHAQTHPNEVIDDAACDEIIEELGPEAAMDAVRRAYDNGAVH